MLKNSNQRWRERRTLFVPDTELIDPSRYSVDFLDGKGSDKIAKTFVEAHHYSGSYPAARERAVLSCDGEVVGVAVFSQPASEAVLEKMPCEREAAVELGRLVLLDNVPGNGETWMLARAREGLRKRGYKVLLSHSDPMPRRALDGELVLPGHVGLIYQADNAHYAGRAGNELHVLKPDGTILSPRSMTKIRRWERGAEREVERLVAIGAARPSSADLETRDARRAWLWREIFRTCRRLPHPGNHRYLWAIDKKLEAAVVATARGDRYTPARARPKAIDAESI